MITSSKQRAVGSKSIGEKKTRRIVVFFCLLLTVLLATGVSSQAQQPKKVPRIGYLETTASSTSLARHEAFRQGLRELGYVEGKSIVIEWRYAEGKVDRQVSRQDVEQ